MIAISLLTLDPWTVGGTQTYARELVRALARHGELDYRVLVSRIAAGGRRRASGDGRAGVPGGRSRLGRTAGARARNDRRRPPAQGASAAIDAAAFHFPLTVMLPRIDDAARGGHRPRPPARGVPGVLLARPARLSTPGVRALGPGEPDRDRRQRPRSRRPDRAARARSRTGADDPPRRRPRAVPARRPRPRSVPALPGEQLAAQEPPAAARGVRLGAARSGRSCGSSSPAPGTTRRRSRRRVVTRPGLRRAARRALSERRGAGVPEPVRRLRAAAVEAMACGCPVAVSRVASLPEVCGDAAVYFDPTSAEDIARGIADVLDRPAGRRPRAGRAVHVGGVRAPPRCRVR